MWAVGPKRRGGTTRVAPPLVVALLAGCVLISARCSIRTHDGAGRHGVAVGVPVTASEVVPSLWPVHVAVTSTVYSVPLVRLGMV